MFTTLGRALGMKIAGDLQQSGRMEQIVRETMAKTWEEAAAKPENAHAADKLRAMAAAARKG